jgi:hypothetical protein
VLTRVALDSSSDYRCEARIGGKCATSLGAESLAALRSMAKRATPAEEERIRTDVHRVFQLLPLFGDEAARARLGKAEAADFDWPALIESHVRMRALLDRAVGAGPAFGGYEDGLGLAAKGDNAEAFASWLEAAHAGDARSMFRVGWAVVADHDFGKPAEGFEWLRRSAEAGYGPAFTILGGTYLRGVGCEPDLAKARRWLEAAVERDDSRARYELGWMCMRGQGVEPEVDRALALWKAAAARGHAPSMNTLGIVFEHGRGVEADAAEAASWYQRAADLGYAEAMVRLGHLYESGRGVPQDKARAFELCKRAVETGSARAKYELAICYDRGTGVDRNPARTRELMLASARGGYGFAQLTVANAYLEGKWGFSKSLPRGAAWLRIAADGGNEKAQKKLEQIEPTMSEAERVIWYATLAELQQEMRKDGQGSGSTR